MIISASRRTDIPAFYGEWFYDRLLHKEVITRNPFNHKMLTRLALEPDKIDCIVFWTKNPEKFLEFLKPISDMGYKYYFNYTITAYDQSMEKNVPPKNAVIDTFLKLSDMIGKEKVIWRYDPVIINNKYTHEFHESWFDYLCRKLGSHTEKCVFSFVDKYTFLEKDFKRHGIYQPSMEEMICMSKILKKISSEYNIPLFTCSEVADLSELEIMHNRCIDGNLVNRINGMSKSYKKDTGQRNECGCVSSKDIGSYGTCLHECVYCYARKSRNKSVSAADYDIHSPMLFDEIKGNDQA